jgi:hypothetical protein
MEPVIRELSQRKLLLGPGDELTLRYAFRPEFSGPRADLLAARNLIYVKLLEKEETLESPEPYAHTRSALEDNSKVARLSYADCSKLYPQVRSVNKRYLSLELEA